MHVPAIRVFIYAIVSVVLFGYVTYGTIEPQASAGLALFHVGYSFHPTRPLFLGFYRSILRNFNGSYIPSPVDTFLAERLWDCRGTSEWTGILDFQLAQTPYRWGQAMSHLPDELKRDIISDLMQRCDAAQPRETLMILLLVESLRRDESFSKTHFIKPYVSTDVMYPIIRERFKTWWGDGSAWPANKTVDPLQDTGIIVHSP